MFGRRRRAERYERTVAVFTSAEILVALKRTYPDRVALRPEEAGMAIYFKLHPATLSASLLVRPDR